MFSAIRSPVFSELAIDLGHFEAGRLRVDLAFFETLRTANAIKPFKLVFLVDSSPDDGPLGSVLRLVTARGLLDFLDSPPTVTRIRRAQLY